MPLDIWTAAADRAAARRAEAAPPGGPRPQQRDGEPVTALLRPMVSAGRDDLIDPCGSGPIGDNGSSEDGDET